LFKLRSQLKTPGLVYYEAEFGRNTSSTLGGKFSGVVLKAHDYFGTSGRYYSDAAIARKNMKFATDRGDLDVSEGDLITVELYCTAASNCVDDSRDPYFLWESGEVWEDKLADIYGIHTTSKVSQETWTDKIICSAYMEINILEADLRKKGTLTIPIMDKAPFFMDDFQFLDRLCLELWVCNGSGRDFSVPCV